MKKAQSRKLNLVRETIAPLNNEQLEDVNGGARSVSISVSRGNSRSVSFSGWGIGISYSDGASISVSA